MLLDRVEGDLELTGDGLIRPGRRQHPKYLQLAAGQRIDDAGHGATQARTHAAAVGQTTLPPCRSAAPAPAGHSPDVSALAVGAPGWPLSGCRGFLRAARRGVIRRSEASGPGRVQLQAEPARHSQLHMGPAASWPGGSLPERGPWPMDTPPRARSALAAQDAQNISSGSPPAAMLPGGQSMHGGSGVRHALVAFPERDDVWCLGWPDAGSVAARESPAR